MRDPETGSLLSMHRPPRSRGFFLFFCRVLNVTTGICSLLCMVAHGMAFFSEGGGGKEKEEQEAKCPRDNRDFQLHILRVFGILWAIIVSLIETEWEIWTRQLRLLEFWAFRGLFHVFLANLTLYIAVAHGESGYDKSVNLYSLVAGYSLLACGLVYILGGVFCFGKIKRALRMKVVERGAEKDRIERDLQALQSKQLELQDRLSKFGDE